MSIVALIYSSKQTPMSRTDTPAKHRPDPERWLLSNLPHTTFFGEAFAYLDTGSGHSTQFYSVAWLVEEFGSIIETIDHPRAQLIRAGHECGPAEVERLFGQIDE